MTLTEALLLRDTTYKGWSDCDLKADARQDILRYLNCLTDQMRFDGDTVTAIKALAKAAHCLEGGHGHDRGAETHAEDMEDAFPTLVDAFDDLHEAFDAFMHAKAVDKDASVELARVFECHRALAKEVMKLPLSQKEMTVVTTALKK